MHLDKLILAGLLALLFSAPAGQAGAGQLQNPYGNQPLPAPNSPYPDQAPSPYGGGPAQAPGQPGSPQAPQQSPATPQGGNRQPRPQQQGGNPPAGAGPVLSDAIGNFRLGLPGDAVPMAATYNFGLPSQQAQVTIMSLGQPQAFVAQQQNFFRQISQMGGSIIDQRQISLQGRPAELVVALARNPETNAQMVAYNVFVASANLWLQVMGASQNQQQVQGATSQILQALTLK